MLHTATIRYDRPLVRRALNRYFARRLGKPFFVVLLLSLATLAYAYVAGSWSRPLTLVAIAFAVALAFLGFVYFARLRSSEGFFDKATNPTVTFTFTDEGVRTESELGTSDLKWLVFDEVLKFPEVWLLVYARSGYMTLPVDQLSLDCLQFIDQQVSNAIAGRGPD